MKLTGRVVRGGVVFAAAGLLALVIGVAPASAFKQGTYTGTTSQVDGVGQPLNVGMKVPKNKAKVKIGYFEFTAPPCGDGMPPGIQMAGESAALRASGKFKFVDEFGYGYIKGQFEHRNASGTARYTFGPRGCDSGVVNWTAEREE
jgi:hypothetical protein